MKTLRALLVATVLLSSAAAEEATPELKRYLNTTLSKRRKKVDIRIDILFFSAQEILRCT